MIKHNNQASHKFVCCILIFLFWLYSIAYSLYYCVYTHASVYSTATLNNNAKEYEYEGIHAESTVIVTPPCHSARRARVARMVARFNSVSNPSYVVYIYGESARNWNCKIRR